MLFSTDINAHFGLRKEIGKMSSPDFGCILNVMFIFTLFIVFCSPNVTEVQGLTGVNNVENLINEIHNYLQ